MSACGSSSGVDPIPDAAVPEPDAAVVTGCVTVADCDDGVACTVDTCSNKGTCRHALNDAACTAPGPCQTSVCAATGCEAANVLDGTVCTDPVGGAEGMCMAGSCSTGCVADSQCDDGVACTTDSCNVETGVCNAPGLDDTMCDDGASCTDDACAATGCTNNLRADDSACQDGSGAAGTCAAGVCVSGCASDADCSDGIACTQDTCDTTIGACSNLPQDSQCDDGVACTADSCSAATGCVAVPQQSQCDDGIACTTDSCSATLGCQHAVQDSLCNDFVGCTADSCSATAGCAHVPSAATCDDGNPCTADVCDATGDCSSTGVPDGVVCQDGAGANGVCTASACVVGCTADAACDNDNACDGVESCNLANGTCVSGPAPVCNDGVTCTTDSCDPATGCTATPNDAACDDGNSCTAGSCSAASGCEQTPVPNTTACSGPTGTGQCQAGTCIVGCTSDTDCNDDFACTTDSCDLSAGTCTNAPSNAACNDNVACTTDTCNPSMGCENVAADSACDDNNPCTVNTCDVSGGCGSANVPNGTGCQNSAGDNGQCSTGTCVVGCTSNAECSDNNACNGTETCNLNNGTCVAGTALVCNDGIACTTDSCDPAAGCQAAANNAFCDDSISCTTDTCVVGTGCSRVPDQASCDDGNECTANVCNGATGCGATNVVDGTPCAAGVCTAGVCGAAARRGVVRFNTLKLEDPHMILEKTVFIVNLCQDITNTGMTSPVAIPAINSALNTLVTTDADGNGFLDYSFALAFEDLSQVDGAVGAGQAVESNCASMTSCVPTPGGQLINAGYRVKRTGTCMPPNGANLDPVAWTDGPSVLNQPTAGVNGCFITDAVDFTLSIELQGSPVSILLTDTVIAGSFNASPATGITNGVLIGWLSEARADALNISVPSPIGNVSINLGKDVLPESNACTGHDGRDTHNGESGWWFMVNLTGASIATDVASYFP